MTKARDLASIPAGSGDFSVDGDVGVTGTTTLTNSTSGSGVAAELIFGTAGNAENAKIEGATSGTTTGTMKFYTDTAGTLNEKMRVDSSGNLDLTNGGGNIIMANGAGIDFSATSNSSGTMSSELFADYEEGTWSPSLIDASNNAAISYNNNNGRYVKIGSMVTVYFNLRSNNFGSLSGDLYIGNIPYNASQVSNPYPQGVLDVYSTQVNLLAGQCLQISSSDKITLLQNLGTQTTHQTITTSNVDTGTTIRGQIQYFTY